MEAKATRPWYRLHAGTAFTVFFVAVAWFGVFFGTPVEQAIGWEHEDGMDIHSGWPFVCCNVFGQVSVRLLVLDLAVAFACLTGVTIVVERVARQGLRCRVSTILLLLTVVAILCAFARWDGSQPGLGPAFPYNRRDYQPLAGLLRWHEFVPVYFALGCLAYAALWLPLRATSWAIARLRAGPPAPVRPEAH